MLRVENLSVARGGVPVLEGVNLTVSAGEVLILRGPNGIGKTTLLRTLAGLQPSLAGHISGGYDAAYAGHADGIKLTLSVLENLTFWAQVFGCAGIDAALDQFDLRSLADRPAGSLSAGQKRRLGLARMLVTGCKLWIMDEPTVSLDQASVQLFADVVTAHLQMGGAALLATHIDLGLPQATVLDLTPFKAKPATLQGAYL